MYTSSFQFAFTSILLPHAQATLSPLGCPLLNEVPGTSQHMWHSGLQSIVKFQGPRNICGIQGCNQLLSARGVDTSTPTAVFCCECSRKIFADNSLKICIVKAGRRREKLQRKLLWGTAIGHLHHLVNHILSYVGGDLGRLSPNVIWKYLLDSYSTPYAIAAQTS